MDQMTDLLTRPILRVPPTEEGPARPVALSATLAAGVTALGGLVLCVAVAVAVWLTGDSGSVGSAIRAGALGWLVGNGAGLHAGTTSVTALPLGFMAVAGLVLYRGGRWAAVTSAGASDRGFAGAVAAMAGAYAVVAAVTEVMAGSAQAGAPLARTVLAALLLGGGCGGCGLAVASGRLAVFVGRLPEEVRAAGFGAAVGCCVMMLAAAVLLTGSLVAHLSRAVQLADGLQAGLLGGAVVMAAGLALLPNALLCAVSFVAGPGFAVGAATTVSPARVRLGPLPDFPLLAALPATGPHRWQAALIVIPVLAGAAAGLMTLRRHPVYGLDQVALRGGLAGLAGGIAVGLATVLATGSIGPGRMAHLGPDWAATTLVCAVAMLLGGALGAAGWRWVTDLRRGGRHPVG